MGEARPDLTDRDVLLLVANAAGGIVDGRTVAQKLTYFVAKRLHRDLEHHAHFYGPFSSNIEMSLKLNVLAEEMKETVETIPSWYGGPDIRKYSYELTDAGRQRVEQLRATSPSEAKTVEETIAAIEEAIPGLKQRPLSAAAKIDLILTEQGRAVRVSELGSLADDLGWKLTEDEVKQSVGVLESLDLVTSPA
jgi:uncharacterized protein YwgA